MCLGGVFLHNGTETPKLQLSGPLYGAPMISSDHTSIYQAYPPTMQQVAGQERLQSPLEQSAAGSFEDFKELVPKAGDRLKLKKHLRVEFGGTSRMEES